MQERNQPSRDDIEKTVSMRADDTDKFDEVADPGLSDDDLMRIENAVAYVDRISTIREELEEDSQTDSPTGTDDRIGRFEVVKSIGEGGFAQVYLARDPQLDRLVAIKVPHLQRLLSTTARARFRREAKAAGILSHPNIVPIFEIGEDYVAPYIVSEYCEGATLLNWIKDADSPVEPQMAARIVSILSDAMQYSHSRGVVHRDLKPANIVFAQPEQAADSDSLADSIRILDFGLAKLTETDESLTVDGDIVGTPAYMAPEVARGEEATAASDIYSLGVILYRLLTNDLPHAGDSHLAILRSIETETPESPRERLASVPRDLDSIVAKCMRKSPSYRYQNAHELHTDLNRWLSGRPVFARPISRLEKVKMWYVREKRFANALLLAFTILTAAVCVTTWLWRDSASSLAAATEGLQIARGANKVSVRTTSDYLKGLHDLSDIQRIVRDDPDANPELVEKLNEIALRVEQAEEGKEPSLQFSKQQVLEQDAITAWAARIVAAKQCEIAEFRSGIATLRSAEGFTKEDRIGQAITGGSYAYVYGVLDRDRARLRADGFSDEEIDKLREELRSDAIKILEESSKGGSLWIDEAFWGPLYEDDDFKRIISSAEFPMFVETGDPSQSVTAVKGAVANRLRKSLMGFFKNKPKKESKAEENAGGADDEAGVEESPPVESEED